MDTIKPKSQFSVPERLGVQNIKSVQAPNKRVPHYYSDGTETR